MIKNSLKVSFRHLRRQKGFTVINLGGLAVGLAACLLIGLYIQEELNYDRFHTKSDRIYRLGGSTVGWPYGRLIEEEFPEVEAVSYMRSYPTYPIEHAGSYLFENMSYADESFFKIFDFPLLEGNPEKALEDPYSVVLSENLAKKLFNNGPALEQTVSMGEKLSFKVTGVVRIPRNSHIQFDALLSFDTLRAQNPEIFDEEMSKGWLDLNVINYVLLKEGTDAKEFEAKVLDLPRKYAGAYLDSWGANYKLCLEPMSGIYLHSKFGNSLGPKSDISYVYLLLVVGLFLLIIAAANFINLSTARSVNRAKEVGVRKVVGSTRQALVRQFLSETFLTCFLAVLLAFGLALIMLPLFNKLAAREYVIGGLLNLQTGLLMLGLVAVMSLLAGIYPAISLSSYRPIEVLRGSFQTGKKGLRLRQGLVVVQFVISSILIIGTLVVSNQLNFMMKQDLGFDADQVLTLDARRAPYKKRTQQNNVFIHALAGHSSVQEVSSMGGVPGRIGWRGQISFPEGWPKGKSLGLEYIPVDYDFAQTLGLKIMAGRNFDSTFTTDLKTAVIINESAVEAVGWSSPADAIGKGFASPGSGKPDGIVIGVVENYHHHGLQEKIEPMMFGIREVNSYYALRIDAAGAASVVKHVQQSWDQFYGGYPYELFFLDEEFKQQYEQEQRLMRIFSTFTLLTILIACMGLFGLTAFTSSQRIKEIGVRKVLGATVPDIIRLLSVDFLKLVLVSLGIAAPIGYYLMQQWQQNFAYRTSIRLKLFLFNAVLLLLIAFVTICFQSIKTALADPAQSLRHE